jgi:uncharacterized protein (TIGR02147 family)
MEKSVFEYRDYKEYLGDRLAVSGQTRGQRSKLAETLGCQTAFVSQVVNGHTHFSLEHAIVINQFLSHTESESHYFMLLVHQGRAGTKTLREYYSRQIEAIHEKRQVVHERIQVKQTISVEDQMIYYSAWYYATVHVMLSIPEFQNKAAIAQHLNLPLSTITKCIEFLTSLGLATDIGKGRYGIGTARIHLGQDSPMLSKHHTNWRMKAITSLDRFNKDDLHYSSVVTLSEKDATTVKSVLLSALEKTELILGPSKEEAVFSLAMDFFRI